MHQKQPSEPPPSPEGAEAQYVPEAAPAVESSKEEMAAKKTKRARRVFDEETKAKIVQAYANRGDKTVKDIAEQFDTSETNIHKWAAAAGVDKQRGGSTALAKVSRAKTVAGPTEQLAPSYLDLQEENARLKAENAKLRAMLGSLLVNEALATKKRGAEFNSLFS